MSRVGKDSKQKVTKETKIWSFPTEPRITPIARRWTSHSILAKICLVKLPANATIAPEKLNKYLLVRQSRGDKSVFLANAAYTAANPEQLLHDLREQVLSQEAVPLHRTKFGQFYEIRAPLTGPNRTTLQIGSIWMKEHLSGVTKFITLVPDRTE